MKTNMQTQFLRQRLLSNLSARIISPRNSGRPARRAHQVPLCSRAVPLVCKVEEGEREGEGGGGRGRKGKRQHTAVYAPRVPRGVIR